MNLLIKLISVGWGSTGYYSREVLERDGSGTKILNSHVNANPESPARQGQGVSGDDLVGKLLENAYFDANGPQGEGLYARVQVYDDYAKKWGVEKIKDMQFSIFALAKWGDGEVDGRAGKVAQSLHPTSMNTVDAVVFGGAGGMTVAIESAEFCDSDCPIVSIHVLTVEATTDNKTVAESHKIQTPSSDGVSEDNNMDLQKALARIAELEAQTKLATAENATLVKERKEIKTAFDKMAAEHRAFIAERAVAAVLGNVQFNDSEAKELVIDRITRGVEWKDDGSVDTEMLAESAKPYTEGTSSLVFSSESGGAYKIPSYTTGFSPVPQGDKQNSSEYESILNSAVDGEFNF